MAHTPALPWQVGGPSTKPHPQAHSHFLTHTHSSGVLLPSRRNGLAPKIKFKKRSLKKVVMYLGGRWESEGWEGLEKSSDVFRLPQEVPAWGTQISGRGWVLRGRAALLRVRVTQSWAPPASQQSGISSCSPTLHPRWKAASSQALHTCTRPAGSPAAEVWASWTQRPTHK